MEYHPEWDLPDPQYVIDQHEDAMIRLLTGSDLDAIVLKREVESYMNVNAMLWGWKEPSTDRDKIDLLVAIMQKNPRFRCEVEYSSAAHLLHILKTEEWERPETMEDHYQPRQYVAKEETKRRKRPNTDLDWTNGNGPDGDDDSSSNFADAPTYHAPSGGYSHSSSGDSGSSDGGGGGGGD